MTWIYLKTPSNFKASTKIYSSPIHLLFKPFQFHGARVRHFHKLSTIKFWRSTEGSVVALIIYYLSWWKMCWITDWNMASQFIQLTIYFSKLDPLFDINATVYLWKVDRHILSMQVTCMFITEPASQRDYLILLSLPCLLFYCIYP